MNVALNRVGSLASGGRVSALAIGFFAMATVIGCNHSDQRSASSRPPPHAYTEPTSAEQRRAEERRDERRAEERRAEERTEERRAEDRRAEERREEERAHSTPRAVGGGPVRTTTTSSAVGRIAVARCDREVHCNHVGAKERYASRADCITKWESDTRDDLNRAECPGGIEERELESCLDAVRTESCGNPVDAIDRLNACRTGKLCLK